MTHNVPHVVLTHYVCAPCTQNATRLGNMTASAWLSGAETDDSVFKDANSTDSKALLPHAKAGGDDVSTERRPGTFTNQQVPKNLTDTDLSQEATSATAKEAASGLADALPANLPADLEKVGNNISDALKNVTTNLTNALGDSAGSGPVRQQLERVLHDGSSVTEKGGMQGVVDKSEVSSLHGDSDMIGVGQYNSSSKRLRESTRMSQLFGVFGALLVFALWMLRRRRKPHHSHVEPGLLGPGVDQGSGGWLRPRSGRHRLGTA